MGAIVHLGQMLKVQVGIDLRGPDVGVTEQLLHRAQIPTRLQQVRRERVAQHMRMDVSPDPALQGSLGEPRLHRARRDPAPVATHEQCTLAGTGKLLARRKPRPNRFPRMASDRHHPDLASLAEHGDEPGFEVLFDPGCCPHTIFPNTLVPMFEDGSNPYRDIRVRQAMNHAVDVETIYTTLATGREQRAYGIGTRQLGGMQPEQSGPLTMEYDVEKAMQLMDAAGYADGFESDFYGTAGFFAWTDQIALSVQQYLDVVGIRTNLQLDPLPDFRARMAQRDVPGLHYYFTNQSPDPFQVINAEVAAGGTLSVAEYPESGIQELVEAQRSEFDPAKRKQYLNELAQLIYTNASWLFLFETVGTGLMRDDLEWDMKGNSRDYGGLWGIRPLVT